MSKISFKLPYKKLALFYFIKNFNKKKINKNLYNNI